VGGVVTAGPGCSIELDSMLGGCLVVQACKGRCCAGPRQHSAAAAAPEALSYGAMHQFLTSSPALHRHASPLGVLSDSSIAAGTTCPSAAATMLHAPLTSMKT
jgi:hypothetical protein